MEIQTLQVSGDEFVGNDNVCTLCEEFAGQALDYLGENKTQTEIIETLHQTCSQLHSFKQQVVAFSNCDNSFVETAHKLKDVSG